MSREEIESILDEREQAQKRKGFSKWDRIVGATIAAILAGLHFAPSSDHNWIADKFDQIIPQIQGISTDIAVMKATAGMTTDQIKDHEGRLRTLEYDDKSGHR